MGAQASSEDDVSSADGENQGKLGDKLFDSDDDKAEESKKAAELHGMSPDLMRKIIESDSPELMGLLNEFKEALS